MYGLLQRRETGRWRAFLDPGETGDIDALSHGLAALDARAGATVLAASLFGHRASQLGRPSVSSLELPSAVQTLASQIVSTPLTIHFHSPTQTYYTQQTRPATCLARGAPHPTVARRLRGSVSSGCFAGLVGRRGSLRQCTQ